MIEFQGESFRTHPKAPKYIKNCFLTEKSVNYAENFTLIGRNLSYVQSLNNLLLILSNLLIKLVDIVGESNLEDLDINTVNLLVSTMNELKNVDLRNEILIEVLPLKV